jgi:hypothetical protein
MNRRLFSLQAISEWFFRFFSLDVYIRRDDSGMGFFSIAREVRERGTEYWGFGWNVIVSPLRLSLH